MIYRRSGIDHIKIYLSNNADIKHQDFDIILHNIFSQDPRVLDAMLPYLVSFYGNPHSRTHAYGWESEAAMEKAREVLQKLLTSIT